MLLDVSVTAKFIELTGIATIELRFHPRGLYTTTGTDYKGKLELELVNLDKLVGCRWVGT